MRSATIAERNRANARKSTGPRSAHGKAVVSRNARRHGVTSKPDPTSVAAWLRIILDAPDLAPGDLLKDDRRTCSALALAEAEVRSCYGPGGAGRLRARGGAALRRYSVICANDAETIMDALREKGATVKELRSGSSLLRRIAKATADDTARGGRRHRLLRRYLREARGNRKRAFRAWLECLGPTGVRAEISADDPRLPKQSQIPPSVEIRADRS